ncbi:MAG: hypothetical protein M1538_02485 [Candidatus Marsarchaeota archaeon]|jgi:ribosomal protein S24E|nr:hypothetical protein [Candidatus Marsarchaeota archaeon]
MELKINKDVENKIMNRREIDFYVVSEDKTISKEEAKKEICKKLNLNPELTIIVKIAQEFGMKRSRVSAHNYKNMDSLNKFVQKYIPARLNKKKKESKGTTEKKAAAVETKAEAKT